VLTILHLQAPLQDLVRGTSSLILQNGGAVRGMQNWGRRALPQRARRHQLWHTEGE
jgi:small subunit ribosomal protein S6